MKAIYVVSPGGRSGPGGMCRLIDYSATEWEIAGRQPALVVVDSCGPISDWRRNRFSVWRQPIYFARAVWFILSRAMLHEIAVLHIHVADRGSIARKAIFVYIGHWFGIPIVLHNHAGNFRAFYAGLSKRNKRRVRQLFRKGDRFLVLGESWKDYFIEMVGIEPQRIVVVQNAILAPPRSDPATREPAVVSLLFAGRLSVEKGLDDLLASMAQIADLSWRLTIIGDGDKDPWKDRANRLGISGRVDILGHVLFSEVHRLLDASDLLVLPSHFEAMPMIILEAMAHGVPTVATRVGSIPEMILDGQSGILVPVQDVASLTQAIRLVIADPARRTMLGEAARSRYENNYSIDRMNRKFQQVYAEVQ